MMRASVVWVVSRYSDSVGIVVIFFIKIVASTVAVLVQLDYSSSNRPSKVMGVVAVVVIVQWC